MKRRREEDEGSSVLRQSLDGGAEGPSTTDGDNDGVSELEPKHKVFLSHSGFQKDFTEQLCVDLERCHYYPFFDKRDRSLPKGRKFPELIFQAAKQCQVAVLILSEDFFTRTKWPMLELEEFVEAQKRDLEKISILPVYLGISRHECTKNEEKRLEWISLWREWAKSGERIDVEKWVEALKVLGPSNGIEYVQSLGEVTLREQIVSAVRGLVPPEMTWSVGQIQGRTRICKVICEKFERTNPSPMYGVCVVGVYGTGGVGKTTFCKVLCDELSEEFKGKVCHGELGMKSSFDLQKQVLRNLTDIDEGILKRSTNEDMTMNLLGQRIRQQQVFLALDNVWPEFIEEAKVYLRAGFHNDSIVMVTARSIDMLTRLNLDKNDCIEMPELEEEDAKQLFLHHAAFGVQFHGEGDKQRILQCVRECKFQKGVERGEHFHPLALKVLGAQLGSLGLDPQMWVNNLLQGEEDKFNQFGENEQQIFSVLRRGYDSLSEEDKLLFMDSVLFHPPQRILSYRDKVPRVWSGDVRHRYEIDIHEWLSVVHHNQTNIAKIVKQLQGLKAKSIIEDIGDGFRGVIIHDLYHEFAKMEVKRGALDKRYWVWYNGGEAYANDLARTPCGSCWVNVKRVFLKHDPWNKCNGWSGSVEGIKWAHFSNIEVLHLHINTNEVLDLRGLRCLRSLEVRWGEYDSDRGKGEGKLDGLGELRNLRWLELWNIHYARCIKEIGCLTALEVLRLDAICDDNCEREPLSPPNLEKCIHLRELILGRCVCMKVFPDLSRLISLRKVFFEMCTSAKVVVGLTSEMRALQALLLIRCDSLCDIPGLSDLVSLQEFSVGGCSQLRQLPDLSKLMKLQRLFIFGKFNQPLGFCSSMPLKVLFLGDVEGLHDLDMLRDLQLLVVRNFSRAMLPNFGSIIALEELILFRMPEVQELPKMHDLSRLQRFTINDAPKLHQLVTSDLVGLQQLILKKCGNSVGKVEIPDLHRLVNLQSLVMVNTPVRSLPSLKPLTQLKELDCRFMELAELPELTGLTLLERIVLYNCYELTSLGNLADLPALEYLNVSGCCKLKSLPDLRSLENLRKLNLCRSGVLLSSEDIEALATLSICEVFICDHLQLNVPKMLKVLLEEKVSLIEVLREEAQELLLEVMTEVVMKIEAEQLEYFERAYSSDCSQCHAEILTINIT